MQRLGFKFLAVFLNNFLSVVERAARDLKGKKHLLFGRLRLLADRRLFPQSREARFILYSSGRGVALLNNGLTRMMLCHGGRGRDMSFLGVSAARFGGGDGDGDGRSLFYKLLSEHAIAAR